MERVAIFVDVQNVYYTSRQTYRKNFDYNAFWRTATANRQVVKAYAYAVERGDAKQRGGVAQRNEENDRGCHAVKCTFPSSLCA